MIIKPKKWKRRAGRRARPRFRGLVTYMLQGKGTERCTWYMAGNLEGMTDERMRTIAIKVVEASSGEHPRQR